MARHHPDICTCLGHRCPNEPQRWGLCALCEAMACECPDERREPSTPVQATPAWPRSIPCSVCRAPWHESVGHVEVRTVDRAMLIKYYCWRCTLELIDTIKRYDWSQQPKGLRRSAQPLLRGRPLMKLLKVTAEL